ncbi:unnamed protein product [Peniophora sp. CBMAI 1063]|nr:unnamed protein product [Peniophora sp. CBMAI 1063]
MLAHSTPSTSESGWTTKGCAVCASRVSPPTSDALPRVNAQSAPKLGQIWVIEESIFTPVAKLLGKTMPEIIAGSVTSFSDDRASKPRPCVIFEQTAKNKSIAYIVYMFGTFNGGKIDGLPKALQYWLAQVDPQASGARRMRNSAGKRLPCLHASPCWGHHPQYLVALPHQTSPGFSRRRVLNHLDRPWTNCDKCTHAPTYNARNNSCPTFEFSSSQREQLEELAAKKMREWHSIPAEEMATMTEEFQICLDAKIEANARRNASVLSFGSAGSEMASQLTRGTRHTQAPARPSKLRDCVSAAGVQAPAKEEPAQAMSRKPSLSESSSGESEPEPETPALPHAELPAPLIVGIDRLTLDSATDSQPELADTPTPKRKAFGRHPAVPSSPTGSTRSFPRSLLDRALRPIKNQAGPAKTAEDWPSLPTSPTTPTNSSRRHRRRDSRASKASTARGV